MSKAILVFNDEQLEPEVLRLGIGFNLINGEKNFLSIFKETTSLEEDLLNLASSIFACDLAFKRGEREKITRKIELTVPVVNLAAFNNIRDDLHYVLFLLSHDAWQIKFIQRHGLPEQSKVWFSENSGKVLLFSGGLDAFSAAIEFGNAGEIVQLVSHVTGNQTVRGAQRTLFDYVQKKFPDQFSRIEFRVSCRNQDVKGYLFPSDTMREETQRTRSFLFLSLASLVARRKGFNDIILIAENGQMAIHLPLTAARISAFSTYTAHPEFVFEMSKILSTLLNYTINVENPFLYRTKAEVVKSTVMGHRSIVDKTVSCWRTSRISGIQHHCGICIPCLIRRIALESNYLKLNEYQRDIFRENVSTLDFEDNGKRNLVEFCELVKIFENNLSQAALEERYPELVNKFIDSKQAIEMYSRFAQEARSIFNQYPLIKTIIG
ncbi:MAG: 7-cyano-7-deazaguanine synthase [Anaerolineales bacterium]|nr:7-cyano-7-deazaguanine synthase [Anaerolineales bacterium]